MAQIGVQIDDAQLEAELKAMAAQAGGLKPVLQVIGRKVGGRIRIGFKTGTAPDGEKWAPLKFRLGQPLRDTARLQNSVVQNVGPDYVDVGTNVKYGRVHQFGAEIVPKKPGGRLVFMNKAAGGLVFAKKVRIPARPFLPLDQAGVIDLPTPWQEDVVQAMRRHILRQKQT